LDRFIPQENPSKENFLKIYIKKIFFFTTAIEFYKKNYLKYYKCKIFEFDLKIDE